MIAFEGFPKIPRLNREVVITEKIDGTNASIYIGEDGTFLVGSRTRWITPEADNFGFAKWAHEHREELMQLGPGHHFGEWWGSGIQRGYGLKNGERHFSLFNTTRWSDVNTRPACCDVVPILETGTDLAYAVAAAMHSLCMWGSYAVARYPRPEGIVIYHTASRSMFKVTLENDEAPKGSGA